MQKSIPVAGLWLSSSKIFSDIDFIAAQQDAGKNGFTDVTPTKSTFTNLRSLEYSTRSLINQLDRNNLILI